jgi:hypothetical protein
MKTIVITIQHTYFFEDDELTATDVAELDKQGILEMLDEDVRNDGIYNAPDTHVVTGWELKCEPGKSAANHVFEQLQAWFAPSEDLAPEGQFDGPL